MGCRGYSECHRRCLSARTPCASGIGLEGMFASTSCAGRRTLGPFRGEVRREPRRGLRGHLVCASRRGATTLRRDDGDGFGRSPRERKGGETLSCLTDDLPERSTTEFAKPFEIKRRRIAIHQSSRARGVLAKIAEHIDDRRTHFTRRRQRPPMPPIRPKSAAPPDQRIDATSDAHRQSARSC